MANVNFNDLKKFLVKANMNGYAGDGKEVTAQRPGFEELEYREGDWLYHDSYSGHYFAPGQEVVYYKNEPVWAMAYAGGMEFQYHGNAELAHETFTFLKKALLALDPEKPFRGPAEFTEDGWRYISTIEGDVKDFTGNEKIYKGSDLLFEQNFIGGVIV